MIPEAHKLAFSPQTSHTFSLPLALSSLRRHFPQTISIFYLLLRFNSDICRASAHSLSVQKTTHGSQQRNSVRLSSLACIPTHPGILPASSERSAAYLVQVPSSLLLQHLDRVEACWRMAQLCQSNRGGGKCRHAGCLTALGGGPKVGGCMAIPGLYALQGDCIPL